MSLISIRIYFIKEMHKIFEESSLQLCYVCSCPQNENMTNSLVFVLIKNKVMVHFLMIKFAILFFMSLGAWFRGTLYCIMFNQNNKKLSLTFIWSCNSRLRHLATHLSLNFCFSKTYLTGAIVFPIDNLQFSLFKSTSSIKSFTFP